MAPVACAPLLRHPALLPLGELLRRGAVEAGTNRAGGVENTDGGVPLAQPRPARQGSGGRGWYWRGKQRAEAASIAEQEPDTMEKRGGRMIGRRRWGILVHEF